MVVAAVMERLLMHNFSSQIKLHKYVFTSQLHIPVLVTPFMNFIYGHLLCSFTHYFLIACPSTVCFNIASWLTKATEVNGLDRNNQLSSMCVYIWGDIWVM